MWCMTWMMEKVEVEEIKLVVFRTKCIRLTHHETWDPAMMIPVSRQCQGPSITDIRQPTHGIWDRGTGEACNGVLYCAVQCSTCPGNGTRVTSPGNWRNVSQHNALSLPDSQCCWGYKLGSISLHPENMREECIQSNHECTGEEMLNKDNLRHLVMSRTKYP